MRAARVAGIWLCLLCVATVLGFVPARVLSAQRLVSSILSGPSKLDRHLRHILENSAQTQTVSPDTGIGGAIDGTPLRVLSDGGLPAVDVLVQAGQDVSRELAEAGATVRTSTGRGGQHVHSARVPIASLQDVASIPAVSYVEASLPMFPSLDLSTSERHTQAGAVWSAESNGLGQSITGRGAIVAVVDTGLDWSHQDFIGADGHSRVLALWDQTASPSCGTAGGTTCGRIWERSHLNAWLAADITPGETCATVACQETGADAAPSATDDAISGAGAFAPGHGTHVTAIAASGGGAATGGSPAGFKGMAPDAEILVVKTDLWTAQVLDAWQWVVARARGAGKPVVIVNAFGAHIGAHDGSSALEAAIDNLSGPGVIFTVAAGNSGTRKDHGSGRVEAGTPSTAKLQFDTLSGRLAEATLDIWYRSADSLNISLTAPDGATVFGPVTKGSVGEFTYAPTGTRVTINQGEASPSTSATTHASIRFSRASPPLQGDWTLSLSAVSLGGATVSGPLPGRWDGWISGAASGRLVWLTATPPMTNGGLDQEITLTEPATAGRAVVVGSYVSRTAWTSSGGFPGSIALETQDAVSPFSARGTTRDGRQKPDLVAPGQAIIAARSTSVAIDNTTLIGPNQRHRVLQGTSMAAPHVAGAIALMLQVRPSLTPEEALHLLREHALRDSMGGFAPGDTWTSAAGAGKLRALAPVQMALALQSGQGGSPAPPPSATPSPSPTATATVTPPATATATASATATATASTTATITPSPTATATTTSTATASATQTVTASATPSATPSATASSTPSRTPTPTPSVAASTSPTPATSVTPGPSPTMSNVLPTATIVPTPEPSMTLTPSVTSTATPSSTSTPTATVTASQTPTVTATQTTTAAATSSATATLTVTPTPTVAVTSTSVATLTPTVTSTSTATPSPTVSPSLGVTATRTPTATPVSEVIARLTFRRAVPSPAAAYATDVTLWVYPNGSTAGSREPVATFQARTDTTGSFTVEVAGGLNGRYDFVVKPVGALSRELNGVYLQHRVAEHLDFGPFEEGDADGDDRVGQSDLALLKSAFTATAGEPAYDARTDFDRDGRISLLDFSLLSRSYGLTGPRQER